jgi:hypothetical protein
MEAFTYEQVEKMEVIKPHMAELKAMIEKQKVLRNTLP